MCAWAVSFAAVPPVRGRAPDDGPVAVTPRAQNFSSHRRPACPTPSIAPCPGPAQTAAARLFGAHVHARRPARTGSALSSGRTAGRRHRGSGRTCGRRSHVTLSSRNATAVLKSCDVCGEFVVICHHVSCRPVGSGNRCARGVTSGRSTCSRHAQRLICPSTVCQPTTGESPQIAYTRAAPASGAVALRHGELNSSAMSRVVSGRRPRSVLRAVVRSARGAYSRPPAPSHVDCLNCNPPK